MMTPEKYATLYHALENYGVKLINTRTISTLPPFTGKLSCHSGIYP
jgi:hypothetical protein